MQIKGSWGCCADDCKFQHHFCWVYWFLSHGVVMIGSMPTRKKRYIHVEPCNGLALCLVGIHLMRVQPKKSWVKKQLLQEQAVHHHNSLAKVGIDPWYPWGWHKHSWFGIVFFPRHILLKSNSGISSPSSCVSCMSIDEPLESVLKTIAGWRAM